MCRVSRLPGNGNAFLIQSSGFYVVLGPSSFIVRHGCDRGVSARPLSPARGVTYISGWTYRMHCSFSGCRLVSRTQLRPASHVDDEYKSEWGEGDRGKKLSIMVHYELIGLRLVGTGRRLVGARERSPVILGGRSRPVNLPPKSGYCCEQA